MAMRRALAGLTVAVTDSRTNADAAAERALAVLDWTRLELATGRMEVDVYVSEDMPRGWALIDGDRQVLIAPANAPMVTGLRSPELATWPRRRGVVGLERLLCGPALRTLALHLQSSGRRRP